MGRETMVTLAKPRADLTISRFLEVRKMVRVERSSEVVWSETWSVILSVMYS